MAPRSLGCLETSSLHHSAFPTGPTPRGMQATTPTHPVGVAVSERVLLIFTLAERRERWKPRGVSLIQSFTPGMSTRSPRQLLSHLCRKEVVTHLGTWASQQMQRSTRTFLSQGHTPIPSPAYPLTKAWDLLSVFAHRLAPSQAPRNTQERSPSLDGRPLLTLHPSVAVTCGQPSLTSG